MCGIAGYQGLDANSLSTSYIAGFIEALNHRGPDGSGVRHYPEDNLWLCHKRLSIIDLSDGGAQPQTLALGNSDISVVYNGEVYNYRELKSELESKGHKFTSSSDTEVLLHCYAEWGYSFVERLNGMWAIAIYDRGRKRLFLSRDRFGVKPLYYYTSPTALVFASELVAFSELKHLEWKTEYNSVACEIGGYNLASTEATPIIGVKQLMPGHNLHFDIRGRSIKLERWWSTARNLHASVSPCYSKQLEEFRSLLYDACSIRMRSDVKFAIALSGGLDSSSIYSVCSDILRGSSDVRPAAFTSSFEDSDIDETIYARSVAEYNNSDIRISANSVDDLIHEIDSSLNVLPLIEKLPSIISVYRLYRDMRSDGFKISIDGHGGDELLGGYNYFVDLALKDSLTGIDKDLKPAEIARLKSTLSIPQSISYQCMQSFPSRYLIPHRLPESLQYIQDDMVVLQDHPFFQGSFNKALYLSFHQQSLPAILRNFDCASMSNGVESRAPLLDWRVVCYSFSLPACAKLSYQYNRRILRDSIKGILPEQIRVRSSKVGFMSAFDSWVYHSVFVEWITSVISSRAFCASSVWDAAAIHKEIYKAIDNGQNHELMKFWPVLVAHKTLTRLGLS